MPYLDTPHVSPQPDGTFKGDGTNLGQFMNDSMIQYGDLYRDNNVFDDWLHPANKEERQYMQQMIMDRASYANKMQGMIEAGINPLTAAAGLAGSSPSSVPSPPSSVNPIGDVANAVGSVAGAFNSAAGGVSALGKLPSEIDNLNSSSAKNFADIGLTNAQTQGVMTDNKYKDEDWRASLNVKRQQFDNMKAEYKNIVSSHDEIMKRIDEMQSQIDLNGSTEDYNRAMEDRVKEETRFLTAKNDFCLRNKLYLTESGIDGYIFSMVQSGADMSQFDKFIETYTSYRERLTYAEQSGISKAERLFGSSKSPWELGDKYLKRLVEWIKSNDDNPDVMREQIGDLAMKLQEEHPDWDSMRIMQELQRMGFTSDELQNAFK